MTQSCLCKQADHCGHHPPGARFTCRSTPEPGFSHAPSGWLFKRASCQRSNAPNGARRAVSAWDVTPCLLCLTDNTHRAENVVVMTTSITQQAATSRLSMRPLALWTLGSVAGSVSEVVGGGGSCKGFAGTPQCGGSESL